jgi:hypothetical protein
MYLLWTPLLGANIAVAPQPQSNDLLQDLLSQVRNAIKNKGVCCPLGISEKSSDPFLSLIVMSH